MLRLWIVQGLIELSANEEQERSYGLTRALPQERNSVKHSWTRAGFGHCVKTGIVLQKNKIVPVSLNYFDRVYFNYIDVMPQTHNNPGVWKYGGTKCGIYMATDFSYLTQR